MNIQSLSVCVPTKGCVNNCKFCVSRMHENNYQSKWTGNANDASACEEFKKRMLFARDNGCNTLILTGTGEALQNRYFLQMFGRINDEMPQPFRWIELQTSGVMLDDENLKMLKRIGVTTISLSLADLFDSERNSRIVGISNKLLFGIEALCKKIKDYDFNLRLSLNMTNAFNGRTPEQIFTRAKELGADQITFRVLYTSGTGCEQDKWIESNSADDNLIGNIMLHIKKYGRKLEVLPFGAVRYSVDEISTVVDDDCMNVESKETMKYLILRENNKLYTRWDDKGSLIF